MNKRFLAMLMALAMLVSMVPTTAFAACSHKNSSWADNGDGTHSFNCLDCGYVKPNTTGPHYAFINPNYCGTCKADLTKPACEHTGTKSTLALRAIP